MIPEEELRGLKHLRLIERQIKLVLRPAPAIHSQSFDSPSDFRNSEKFVSIRTRHNRIRRYSLIKKRLEKELNIMEQKSKAELLEMRRALYAHFDALIARLSEQQLQMPWANGGWSIKDHLAHLTFWERVNLLEILKAIEQGTSWTDPGLESTEEVRDQTNQQVYLRNKDRSLAVVLSEFQVTHQQIMEYLEKLSEEALQTPYEWLEGYTIISWLSEPNGHLEEHEQYIRDWLARQSSAKE